MSAAGWRMPLHLPGDVAHLIRLARYRRAHPRVIIGDLGFGGIWQARIPRTSGEDVYTRERLPDLLDLLDSLDSAPDGGSA